MSDLNNQEVRERAVLKKRVADVVATFGYHQFTAQQIAGKLNVDCYEVLFALHGLASDGVVEHLNGPVQFFVDKWVACA